MDPDEIDTTLHLGKSVIYFDDEKQPHAAYIAYIHPDLSPFIDRPVCNLTKLAYDGRLGRARDIGPAYHDGTIWHIVNKWAFIGEIPDEEWNYIQSGQRKMNIGWIPVVI